MKQTILIAGARGQVASSLGEIADPCFHLVLLGRPHLDLSEIATIKRAIDLHRPAAVVNAAAYTAVDRAETEPEAAFAINCHGAAALATVAADHEVPIIHISTDYVFAGDKSKPYFETDTTGPLGVYGHSKLEGELAVARANPAHVILRTAWVYSPYGTNFLKTMLRLASEGDVVRVVADQYGTPTYAADVAGGIIAVLKTALAQPNEQNWRGVFHMVAEGETNWTGFAEEIFLRSAEYGGPFAHVEPILTADYPTPTKRPMNSRLSTLKFYDVFEHSLPQWQKGVSSCLAAIRAGCSQKGLA